MDEALRLMRMSKISLSDEDNRRGPTDVISTIYSAIRDDAGRRKKGTYSWAELTGLFTGKNYTVRSSAKYQVLRNGSNDQNLLPNHSLHRL